MFSQASVILSAGDRHPPWVDPTEQTPPGQTHHPPRVDTSQQTATAADGTHPAGMHSCTLMVYSHLRSITRLRFLLGSRIVCASIFAIVKAIPINVTEKNRNRNRVIKLRCEWTINP